MGLVFGTTSLKGRCAIASFSQVVVTAEQRAEAHVEGMRELRVVDVAALVHVHRDPQRLLVGLEDLRHCGNDHVAAVAGEHGNAQLLLAGLGQSLAKIDGGCKVPPVTL